MTAIYKREVRSYFNSMIGYVFVAVVAAFIGIFFMLVNLKSGAPYFSYTLSSIVIIFVFSVPMITMKSMAEERRMKTDQMLLTYPVKVSSIVVGKYLAMVTVFLIPMLISLLCPLVINFYGEGSFLIDFSSIFAVFCLGCMFVAIGMFVSSLTESQVISAIGTMGALLLLMLWSSLVNYIPNTAIGSLIGFFILLGMVLAVLYRMTQGKILTLIVGVIGAALLGGCYLIDSSVFAGLLPRVLSIFSVLKVIDNFSVYHVFDVRGLILILSVAALFAFLTVQVVQRRRWS